MAIKNLTVVFIDGKYKVAQYACDGGYPDWEGKKVLTFLRDKMKLDQFKIALRNTTYISDKEITVLWKKYGASDDGWINIEPMMAMYREHPEFSPGTGAEILEMVQNHPNGMKLENELNFAADSLFCKWGWVVDLDTGTFEVYRGYNQIPLTEDDRFYFLREYERGDFHGIRLVAKWKLDKLPTDEEFLKDKWFDLKDFIQVK